MVNVKVPFYSIIRLDKYEEDLYALIEENKEVSLGHFLEIGYLPIIVWTAPKISQEDMPPKTQLLPRFPVLPEGYVKAFLYTEPKDLFSIVFDMISYKTTSYFWEALQKICPGCKLNVPSQKEEYPDHIRKALSEVKDINTQFIEDYLRISLFQKDKFKQLLTKTTIGEKSYFYFSLKNTKKILEGKKTLQVKDHVSTDKIKVYLFNDSLAILVDSGKFVVKKDNILRIFDSLKNVNNFIKEQNIPSPIVLDFFQGAYYHPFFAEINIAYPYNEEIATNIRGNYTVKGFKEIGQSLGIKKFKRTKPEIEKQIINHVLNFDSPIKKPLIAVKNRYYYHKRDDKIEKTTLDPKESLSLLSRTTGDLYQPNKQPHSLSLKDCFSYGFGNKVYCDIIDFRNFRFLHLSGQ